MLSHLFRVANEKFINEYLGKKALSAIIARGHKSQCMMAGEYFSAEIGPTKLPTW